MGPVRRATPEHAERHDDDKVAARILQAIWQASRYFAEGAMNEYNRPAGQRTFQLATGVRDLQRLQEHYHGLWSAALKAGTLTRTTATRGAAVSRQTVDRGLLASVVIVCREVCIRDDMG